MPSLDYPPIQAHRFSNEPYRSGINVHLIDGVSVKVYSPEKTLADCFKFRNRIGTDVVLEALKLFKTRKTLNLRELLKYAKICRVEKVMRPTLRQQYEISPIIAVIFSGKPSPTSWNTPGPWS